MVINLSIHLFWRREKSVNLNQAKKFVLTDLPGHWAGEVLGWTDSAMLTVLIGCFWDSKTLWYTVPVKWFTWLWEKQKKEWKRAATLLFNIKCCAEKWHFKNEVWWCNPIVWKCLTLNDLASFWFLSSCFYERSKPSSCVLSKHEMPLCCISGRLPVCVV